MSDIITIEEAMIEVLKMQEAALQEIKRLANELDFCYTRIKQLEKENEIFKSQLQEKTNG